MTRCDQVKCFDCKGTGSTDPDCELCHGTRSVRLKRAYAKGWRKADLYEEGCGEYCYCPECYDSAGTCYFCCGDGYVDPFIESQQRARVLFMAKYDAMPASFERDRLGRVTVDKEIRVLSGAHGSQLEEEGLIFHLRSYFGDSLSLNEAGKTAALEAEFLYRDLCRQFIDDKRKLKLERELYTEIQRRPNYVECEF